MQLEEHRQAEAGGERGEFAQAFRRQDVGHEQDGVGPMRAGLPDLVGIEDEILPQERLRGDRSDDAELFQAHAKVGAVCEHGNGTDGGALLVGGRGVGHVGVAPRAHRRRGALDLRDESETAGHRALKRTQRTGLARPLFQIRQRLPALRRGEFRLHALHDGRDDKARRQRFEKHGRVVCEPRRVRQGRGTARD